MIFDLTWLCKNNRSFADLVPFLTSCERNSLFESTFVSHLLEEYWKIYRPIIMKKLVVPYAFYCGTNLWFLFTITAAGSEREGMDYAKIVILSTATFI